MRIHILTALALLALMTAPAGANAASSEALGTSCSGTRADICSFDCNAGDNVYVSSGGNQVVTGTCGEATAACASAAFATCQARSPMTAESADRGTCVGAGTGSFSCRAF